MCDDPIEAIEDAAEWAGDAIGDAWEFVGDMGEQFVTLGIDAIEETIEGFGELLAPDMPDIDIPTVRTKGIGGASKGARGVRLRTNLDPRVTEESTLGLDDLLSTGSDVGPNLPG
jgi:hypothetical protein